MTHDIKTPLPPTAGGPTASGRRFLVQLMEYCFREGWRTPDDFIDHFPPKVIMNALESATDLRVSILSAATGIYKEILRRKSPGLAAEDLRLSLEEGTTNSLQLLSFFSPGDRVRYLDPRQIWDFLAGDAFWQAGQLGASDQRRAAARMTFTLSQALDQRLISLREVLDGLGYDSVADSLSPEELRLVVRHALLKGRDGIGLNEKVLLEVLPLDKLVASVPLERSWHEVVVRRLAVPCGLTDLEREERRGRASGSSVPRAGTGAPPPAPAVPRELLADAAAPSSFQQSQLRGLQGGVSPSVEAAESQRLRATEHLRAIGRLPANHEQLSAQVLRSIDAMYALLPSATDDVQRKSVIRQAFSSDANLRAALLGLIELMDSSVDTSDPVIQSAKIDALIKILLFEEQRRKESGRFPAPGSRAPTGAHSASSGPAASHPPASSPSRGSLPPPLPGSVAPAPPSSRPGSLPGAEPAFGNAPGMASAAPPSYPPGAGGPPLPNLPAEPVPSRPRSVPPPLPPSYGGGNS